MEDNYVCSEVLDVLENMNIKYIKRIPQKMMDFLHENKDLRYKNHVIPGKKLTDQNISKDAITMLAMINLKYWVKDEEHKKKLIEEYEANNEFINKNIKLKELFNKK